MTQEVFMVHDNISPSPDLCTLSPSKAYKKAREIWCCISVVPIDSDPCEMVRYVNLDEFYERYC